MEEEFERLKNNLKVMHDLYLFAVNSYIKQYENYRIYLYDNVLLPDGSKGIVKYIVGKGVYGFGMFGIQKEDGSFIQIDRMKVKRNR